MAHRTVHLLIDMVNPFDFDGADELFPRAFAAARSIARLKERLSAARIPTIYVNDNFGHWELGFRELIDGYRDNPRSAQVLEWIEPDEGEHFILKPMHSAFYATSLEVLLRRWGTERLVLTGVAGNICVMFTANDAHMREYELVVPADCTASEDEGDNEWALRQMSRVMRADVRPSSAIELEAANPAQPPAEAVLRF